ncbi:MAG TPA: hypothetical protein VFH39_00630 [Candidatus Saccharimonadales bacterium]|nr:hypothetical protein [Candidatus Saccharimonadales bacterium]
MSKHETQTLLIIGAPVALGLLGGFAYDRFLHLDDPGGLALVVGFVEGFIVMCVAALLRGLVDLTLKRRSSRLAGSTMVYAGITLLVAASTVAITW